MTVPFLRCFRADWATEAYLHHSLRNRKAHLKRREAKWKAAGIVIDLSDSSGAEDGEGESSDDEMGGM